MMKKILLLLCLFPFLLQEASAQENDARRQYEAFKRQVQGQYADFRGECNRKYAEWLKQAWEEYKVLPAVPKPKEEEKPPVVINDKDRQKPIEGKPTPIEEVVAPPTVTPQPVPVAPIREQPQPVEQWRTFVVYGTEMKVRFGDSLRFTLPNCTEQTVAEAWVRLSGAAYNNTIRDCLELRIKKQLSDWAYLKMLDQMAAACMGRGNEATLLMAYVYCQSGYQMRLAVTAGGQLRMLYGSRHALFDIPYFKQDGVRFYPWDGKETNLRVCAVGFPQERPLSLRISQTQDFAMEQSSARTLVSKRYPDIKVTVSTNKNLIAFYNDYPTSYVDDNIMTRWAMYANTPMENSLGNGMYPQLREKIKGLGEKEAMERLLNWVQTAFVYEYDDKVWGCDRAFFAEETIYYPYCDCEDRSILLSRLVRDLLGLRCILVYYPGHLAMAVQFADEVKGDYIQLGDTRFVICDPTYINAPVGMTMPDMDNATAKVILLE